MLTDGCVCETTSIDRRLKSREQHGVKTTASSSARHTSLAISTDSLRASLFSRE